MVVPTGIKGLDKVLGGGFPEDIVVLVTGGPGTGKSILGLQYVSEGLARGERSMYISFEENRDLVIRQAKQMGWDFEKFETKGTLKMFNYNLSKKHVVNVILEIEKEAQNFKPKRMVIDSLSVLSLYAEIAASMEITHSMGGSKDVKYSEEVVTMGAVMGLLTRLKVLDTTVIMTAELPEGAVGLTRDTYSEFLADGIVKMDKDEKTGRRSMTLLKMRLAKIDPKPIPMSITSKGLEVGV